jgi:hypothetical protein
LPFAKPPYAALTRTVSQPIAEVPAVPPLLIRCTKSGPAKIAGAVKLTVMNLQLPVTVTCEDASGLLPLLELDSSSRAVAGGPATWMATTLAV